MEESLGGRIRTRRKALGYTQEQLAREAGVTMNYVARLERDEIADPHVSTLAAIARAGLGVPTSELLGEEPRPLVAAR